MLQTYDFIANTLTGPHFQIKSKTLNILTSNLCSDRKVALFGAFVKQFLNSYSNNLDQIVKTIPKNKWNSYEDLQATWQAGRTTLKQS